MVFALRGGSHFQLLTWEPVPTRQELRKLPAE